jgi:hypothetical protein
MERQNRGFAAPARHSYLEPRTGAASAGNGVSGLLCSRFLAASIGGQEHGRTIPLAAFHKGRGTHLALLRAVTSISIFIRGSDRPAWIIVAAGLTLPRYSFSTGQQGAKSSRFGNM